MSGMVPLPSTTIRALKTDTGLSWHDLKKQGLVAPSEWSWPDFTSSVSEPSEPSSHYSLVEISSDVSRFLQKESKGFFTNSKVSKPEASDFISHPIVWQLINSDFNSEKTAELDTTVEAAISHINSNMKRFPPFVEMRPVGVTSFLRRNWDTVDFVVHGREPDRVLSRLVNDKSNLN